MTRKKKSMNNIVSVFLRLFVLIISISSLFNLSAAIPTTAEPQLVPQPAPQPVLPSPAGAPQSMSPKTLPSPAPSVQPALQQPVPQTPQAMPAVLPAATLAPRQSEEIKNDVEATNTAPKDIYLNFENTELSNFIDYMAELKKINVIPEKGLEGSKISLTIREPLTIDGAWNIFLTVLEMAGFSIVQAGQVYKIIAKDKKLTQPLPAYINTPYQELPDSDLTIRYVMMLTNIQVTDVEPIMASMLSDKSMLLSQKDMNAFIITDKSFNIKAAAKLMHELDQMGLPETVTVLKLKRVNAADTRDLLKSLINKPEGSPLARLLGKAVEGGTEYFSPTTRIIAEERTNSLILLGNNKSIDKIIDFITKHIDTAIKEAESPLHIYELQHIDAKQVIDILKEVTAVPESVTGQTAGKFGSIRGGVKYFRSMNFQVDKDGNRLIVNCVDKQDWKLLKKTIQDLDKPQPQVAIESLLVTISADDMKSLGGMVRNKKHGQIGKNIDFQSANLTGAPSLEQSGEGEASEPISLLGNLLNQIVATQGQTVLTFGPASNIWSVFTMIKKQTNSSILSQPFITVANKTTAHIEVGQTLRIVSEQIGTGDTATQGFIDSEAATKLDITPQINLDGVVRMKIKTEITEFESTDGSNKSQKLLDTNVTVADGQVLVLGGFVKTKVTETKVKTPILGDIPIVGWFFKNQKRIINKQYIFIFMSPTIIKPRSTPGMQLYTKMKLHQATEDVEDAVETKRVMDPIHNWFFNPEKENYSHKVIDFANARYQPTTVDIKNDPYYRSLVNDEEQVVTQNFEVEKKEEVQKEAEDHTPSLDQPKMVEVQATTVKEVEQLPQESIATVAQINPAPVKMNMPLTTERNVQMVSNTVTPRNSNTTKFHKASVKGQDLVFDHHKRNKLQEFLSASSSPINASKKSLHASGA